VHLFTDWLSVWVALFLVLTLLALGKLEIRQTRDQKRTAGKSQNPPDSQHQPVALQHATAQQKHPTEAEHRSAEQAYWERHLETRNRIDWIGWVALTFSAFAAVGVILSFYETWRQADIAQATLIQSTRAWINVSVDPASLLLTWDEAERPTAKVMIKGTNEGNSPALDTEVFPVLFFPQGGAATVIRNRIRELCSGSAMVGNIVFIKDSIDQIGVTSPQDDLVKRWIDRVKRNTVQLGDFSDYWTVLVKRFAHCRWALSGTN